MSPRGLVVIKFGGTSLATSGRIRMAAARVGAEIGRGKRVITVVSAAGTGTDTLLEKARSVSGGKPTELGTESRRELDRILATGEERSAGLLALALNAIGVRARSLRGGEAGISVDGDFGAGRIEGIETTRVEELLAEGIVPVVAGFQGERPDGELLTLGRGGSDITAIALAAACRARACHIVTDVDAVYDRDPHEYEDAEPFPWLDHETLVTLTESGAEVIHPLAARLAAREGVPIHLYSYTAPPTGPVTGTWIESKGHASSVRRGEEEFVFRRRTLEAVDSHEGEVAV